MYRRSQLEILPNFLLAEEADEIRLDVSSGLSLDLATNPTFSPLDIIAPIANVTIDDFGGDTRTKGVLEIDGVATGRIDFENDQDWFAIELEAGDALRVTINSDETSSFYLFLRSGNGNIIAFGDFDVDTSGISVANLFDTAGTYYISVEGYSVADYTLSTSTPVDDFASNDTTTGFLEIGGTATGLLEFTNDEDWFAIELSAGDVLRIELTIADLDANDFIF